MKIIAAAFSFLWPGFSGVVRYGLWSQLAIALIFGALGQTTLALLFLWCDYLSQFVKNSLYVGLFGSWFFLNCFANVRLKRYERMRESDSRGEAFLEAQTHYLKGNWFETECCLKTILKNNPFDADSILFMATLYRHTGRFSEAKRMLVSLEKLDAAYRWQYEIALEKKILREEAEYSRKESDEKNKTAGISVKSVGSERTKMPEDSVASPSSLDSLETYQNGGERKISSVAALKVG